MADNKKVTLADGVEVKAQYVLNVGGSSGNPAGDGSSNTGTVTSVNDTASSTTLLAANSGRYGATIWNDSTAILYVLLGSGTASATNYSVKLQPDQGYEVPYGYTGIIVGIWASDASGAARVTEFT